MSDDVTFVNRVVLRGWAKEWDAMSTHLTTEQGELSTSLMMLEMGSWDSAVTSIDKAAGELLRSGIYATFVANAAEVADGRQYTVDHVGLASSIFGAGGGALPAATERVYSEAINDDDRDLFGGGFGVPPAAAAPAPPPPRSTGSRDEMPAWTPSNPAATSATPPDDPGFTLDNTDAVLAPLPRVRQAFPAPDLVGLEQYPVFVEPDTTTRVIPGEPAPEYEALPEYPVFVDASADQLPPLLSGNEDVSIGFGDDGIAGGVLPTRAAQPGPDLVSSFVPDEIATNIDLVAGVANPDAADRNVRSFGDDGVLGPILSDRAAQPAPDLVSSFVPDEIAAASDIDLVAGVANPDAAAHTVEVVDADIHDSVGSD